MNDDDASSPRRGHGAASEPEGAHAPRPPAPRTPPPPPPAAPSRIPRPLRWLLDDLGLKLLAFVLAVSTWALVRNTQLRTEDTVADVTVEIASSPPDVRLRPTDKLTTKVKLEGTTGSVRRAREQLEQAGRRIKLRVHDLKGSKDDPDRDFFSDPDDFTFPGDVRQYVKQIQDPIEVHWTRVATIELDVEKIQRPDVITGPGYFEPANGSPTLDPVKLVVTGPVEQIARLRAHPESLAPDPVDATAWLKLNPDLTTQFTFSVRFDRWRATAPDERGETLLTISPASVTGKLKVRESKPELAKADVALLYPLGHPASAYDAFDVKILDPGYDARTRRLDVLIKGDPALLADRKNPASGWTLTITLPPPPGEGAPNLDNVPSVVRLVPPPGDEVPASDAKAALRLVSPRTVDVSIVRKAP